MAKIIVEDMQWFPFQRIMLHTADKINPPVDHLQSLLKLL